MRSENHTTYMLFFYEEGDPKDIDFRNLMKSSYHEWSNMNVILDISAMARIIKSDILEFQELVSIHKTENQKSFVILTGAISINNLPEHILTVPSMSEALDAIEIEEIERDLGY